MPSLKRYTFAISSADELLVFPRSVKQTHMHQQTDRNIASYTFDVGIMIH